MRLSELRLGTKLGMGFGAVLLLILAMSAFGVHRVSRIMDLNAEIAEKTQKYVLAAKWKASTQLNLTRAQAIAKSGNLNVLVAYFKPQMKATSEGIADVQKTLEGLVDDEQGKQQLETIARLRAAYTKTRESILKQMQDGDMAGAMPRVDGEMIPACTAYLAGIEQFEAALLRDMEAAAPLLATDAASTRLLTLVMTALAVALGGLLSWLITRSIVGPMRRAIDDTRRIAEGDLTVRMAAGERKDEIGELEDALARMRGTLSGIVLRIRQAAESVAAASSQIASGGQDLSGRTEHAANSLEQTSSSIAELTDSARQTSTTAHGANQLATSASAVAERGGAAVAQVVSTMNDIAGASRRIVDIIGVIDGIAFQTNILALNAAVESARAGEQGRGFAVVASEVRNLAQRSATAAREIKSLIDDSVGKVESGSRQVQDAGETMNEIVANVQRVASMIAEISAATSHQQAGIDRVRTAVTRIDDMTQQNSALVEESAAATSSLREQAQALAEAVRIFRLESQTA